MYGIHWKGLIEGVIQTIGIWVVQFLVPRFWDFCIPLFTATLNLVACRNGPLKKPVVIGKNWERQACRRVQGLKLWVVWFKALIQLFGCLAPKP